MPKTAFPACRCDRAKTSSSASPDSTAPKPMPATKQPWPVRRHGRHSSGRPSHVWPDRPRPCAYRRPHSRCLGGERRASSFFPCAPSTDLHSCRPQSPLEAICATRYAVAEFERPERHVSAQRPEPKPTRSARSRSPPTVTGARRRSVRSAISRSAGKSSRCRSCARSASSSALRPKPTWSLAARPGASARRSSKPPRKSSTASSTTTSRWSSGRPVRARSRT